ncbi:MAG: formate dehydrogenase accessory protein FdhE [Desulfurococcales archaeon]|nr:formate dehydrogenase accessory protein FdhE [Desulfurococcales archaeon]
MDSGDRAIEEKLREFETALDKYLHLLHGGRVDQERAVAIERIELKLQSALANEGLCDPRAGLNDGVRRLLEKDQIHDKLVEIVNELIRDENIDFPTSIDLEKATKMFLNGEVESGEAMVAAIIIQSLARCIAEQRLAMEIEEKLTPYCPVCGAESHTMVVREKGYHMVCPFCGYEWRISKDRPRCPWCGNDNPISIGVFTNRQRRIGLMVCQECGSTWRAILDRRIRAPNILLPLISLGAEAFRTFMSSDMISNERVEE